MKNYSDWFTEKTYILSYKIKNNQIILKLPKRKKYTIPYTQENEQKVIAKMESQVPSNADKRGTKVNGNLVLTISILAGIGLFSVIGVCLGFTMAAGVMLFSFLGACIGGCIGTTIYEDISNQPIVKDKNIEKLHYFLENKQKLNSISLANKKAFIKVSPTAIIAIKKATKQKQAPININNIDSYSLRDLKRLKENLDKMQASEFVDKQTSLEGISYTK